MSVLSTDDIKKLREACGGSEPSAGHSLIDEVCGLLRVTREQRDAAEQRAVKGEAFKVFVHGRFDEMGVPEQFPDGVHSKEGCRVGDRLDWIQARLLVQP